MQQRRILLIGTLDSKGAEFDYVRKLIHARSHGVLMMDTGVLEDPVCETDISAGEVAAAGGSDLGKLREQADRGAAVDTMIAGVKKLVPELYVAGRFDGVMGIGGGGGTNIATAGMRELPVGVPKLMVSTLASSDVSPYVDINDITMMYSVTDIAGLNRISRRILANGAGAICGMVEQDIPQAKDKPMIAATMFGVTTPCVSRLRKRLEEAGYEVVVFHATGSGGRAMEALIAEGYFEAVADITTTEWCDLVVGGVLPAGEDRLSAAGRKGIPQVVSCGALDMVNFHAADSVPAHYRSRNLYRHNPTVTLMRTSPSECREIGCRIAEKLNESAGPVVLLLPLKGLSMIDREGEPFFDPEANQALFESLRNYLQPNVKLVELDLHINDPEFAETAASRLLRLLEGSST